MLTKACPKEPEPIPFKDIEVERSQIKLLKKLGAGQFGEVWAGQLKHIINWKFVNPLTTNGSTLSVRNYKGPMAKDSLIFRQAITFQILKACLAIKTVYLSPI